MIPLDLKLFGGFVVSVAGEQVTRFSTDKGRALLAYLALHPDRPFRRDVLATLLWADWSDKDARRNLRQTLHRLKKTLDKAAPQLGETLLTLTRHTVQLNSSVLSLDVARYQQLLQDSEDHYHSVLHQCILCLERMEQAVAIYEGDLLAGFILKDTPVFDEWLLVEREDYFRRQLDTLQQLTEAFEEQGNFEKAGQFAQQQLHHEPWREAAHRQLMRLLAVQGQRAEAIAQYQSCRQILQEELGVPPAEETEALLAQIVEGSLPVVAPARTTARPYFLPPLIQPLIGRERELEEILSRLGDPSCRILTVTGPGGIGKTSMVNAAGERLLQSPPPWLADGLYFISLADVTSNDQLPAAVAETIDLSLNKRQSVATQVEQYLRVKAVLLILDGFDLLVEDVSWLDRLVKDAPRLKVLISSREPLNRQWEWRYPLSGLAFPRQMQGAKTFAAVQLFVQAAGQVQPGFSFSAENGADIVRICRRVHGWPLALQMAAAWVRLMDCRAIADQIDNSLDFLTTSLRDVPPRQRSIRAIFDYTWSTLSGEEKGILKQLAFFRGGFSLPAAMEVAQASHLLLMGLVDKALVQYDPRRNRFRMHQLLRQFALEKAQADKGAYAAGQQAHGRYYLHLLRKEGERLQTVQFQEGLDGIKIELENIRQAWLWAAGTKDQERLVANLGYLSRFYESGGRPHEGIAFFRRTVNILQAGNTADEPELDRLIANLHYQTASSYIFVGQYQEATAAVQQAQKVAFALDDVPLINLLYMTQARIFREQGHYEDAHAVLHKAINFNQENDNLEGVAHALHTQGNTYWSMSAYEEAAQCYEEARRIYQQLGNSLKVATLTGNLGVVQWRLGRFHEALPKYEQALAAHRKAGNAAEVAIWRGNIGLIYVDLEEDDRALAYLDEALAIHDQLGRKYYKIELYLGKVALYLRRGELEMAESFLQQATDLAFEIGNRTYLLECDYWQARLYAAQQRNKAAGQLMESVLSREFRPDMAITVRQELEQLKAKIGE